MLEDEKKTPYFGIYVKKGDSYAFLKKSEKTRNFWISQHKERSYQNS